MYDIFHLNKFFQNYSFNRRRRILKYNQVTESAETDGVIKVEFHRQ